jgi:hypothetical protein
MWGVLVPNATVAREKALVEASLITWMAVHGGLCLALRHPDLKGPSRGLIENAIDSIGELLVAGGILTEAELAEAQRVEREESPHR